jgi:hypothetical protein
MSRYAVFCIGSAADVAVVALADWAQLMSRS